MTWGKLKKIQSQLGNIKIQKDQTVIDIYIYIYIRVHLQGITISPLYIYGKDTSSIVRIMNVWQ